MTKSRVSNWLHWGGGGLCVAAIWFVFSRLQSELLGVDFERLTPIAWGVLGMLALVYGLANVLLVRAWWYLLHHTGIAVRFGWTFHVYGLSQLAKYVPGNIFHLAGRQALGMAHGLPARHLAKSAMWELGLIAACGAMYAAWSLPMPPISASVPVAGLVFFICVLGLYVGLNRWVSRAIAMAMLFQIAFLFVSGAVFAVILNCIRSTPLNACLWLVVLGCYVIAWLAGLLTPGAPAGVGIREAVLLLLLGHLIPPADLILTVVLGRCTTILGDLLFFFAAVMHRHRSATATEASPF